MPEDKDKDPNAPAAPDPAQPQPRYMTADDFNGAMTARDKRFEQRLAKQFEEFQKTFAAKFMPETTGEEPPPDGEGAHPDLADPKRPAATDNASKRLAAQLRSMEKRLKEKDEAAQKEKAELLARQGKTDTMAALSAAGSLNAKGAYAALKEEGRLRHNAAGEIVVVFKRDYGEEEVALEAGIKEWLGTDDGKHYMPPLGGGEGSGTVVRNGARPVGAPLSKEEQKREAQKLLTSFVLGGR